MVLIMWDVLTEPQAILLSGMISGSLTIIAAALGVWLGSKLFGGKISDLQSLLSESNNHLDNHRADVRKKVEDLIDSTQSVKDQARHIRETHDELEKLRDEINIQLSSVIDGISKLKNSFSDIKDAPYFVETETENGDVNLLRKSIRDDWGAIRDAIEGIASDPEIDGRTRARYGRIDRRQYWFLLEALNDDGRLGRDFKDFITANDIWQRHKSNRTNPGAEDVQAMRSLRETLTKKYNLTPA